MDQRWLQTMDHSSESHVVPSVSFIPPSAFNKAQVNSLLEAQSVQGVLKSNTLPHVSWCEEKCWLPSQSPGTEVIRTSITRMIQVEREPDFISSYLETKFLVSSYLGTRY